MQYYVQGKIYIVLYFITLLDDLYFCKIRGSLPFSFKQIRADVIFYRHCTPVIITTVYIKK